MYATILRHSATAAHRHRTRVAVLARVPALQRSSGVGTHQVGGMVLTDNKGQQWMGKAGVLWNKGKACLPTTHGT
jgi:hypothetical protein